jgi:hypothetical protein
VIADDVDMSRRAVRKWFWVESVSAAASLVLALVTLMSREWIEFLFGVDPDYGSGALEWAIVVGLGVAAVVFGLLSRAEWRAAPRSATSEQ